MIMKTFFKNGWYSQQTPDSKISLYRADGSLVADKLIDCYVFNNGWYTLQTKGFALYRADETLVADKLKWCVVFDDGHYKVITDEGIAFYNADGSLIRKDY